MTAGTKRPDDKFNPPRNDSFLKIQDDQLRSKLTKAFGGTTLDQKKFVHLGEAELCFLRSHQPGRS